MAAAPDAADRTARRYPQPVQVGTLLGRALLQPIEAQPVLGRVAGVARRPDGGTDLLVHTGGLLGFGTRTVAVPIEAVGLLGEHVALLDVTPAQLAALPPADPARSTLPPAEVIKLGLTKPFH